MNEICDPNGGRLENAPGAPRKPFLLVLLVILLFAECLLLGGVAVYLIVELLIDVPQSYPSAVAILLLALLAAVWVAVITVATLRGQSWIRGAAFVWQILQLSIGVGSFQGLFARPDIGWLLVAPAIAVIILLFTPPVLAATARRE